MLRSEGEGARIGKAKESRGIRRPLFKLALVYLLLLCVFHWAGIPLRRPEEAEALLQREGSSRGILRGRISEISLTSSGQYALLLNEGIFRPETGEGQEAFPEAAPLKAGGVLVYYPVEPALEPGLLVECKGRLKLFSPADNPGEFDARAYYLSRGLGCYMEGEAFRILVRGGGPERAAWRVKSFLREGLSKVYTLGEAGLLGAMLLGERSGVEPETEALYEGAGLSHLLSVSGLHVSFWAAVMGHITGFLLSFFPFSRGGGFWSRRGFGFLRALISVGGVLFYGAVCGSRIPVQRAGLMALLYQMAQGLGLSFDLPSALGAAALAALIPAPYALFQPSFQLSFGCVFLLGFWLPLLARRLWMESSLARAFLVPVLVQMGMLPLTLWHYFTFHPYSFLANLLAVPLAGPLLVLGFLSALLAQIYLPLGGILAGAVHLLLAAIRLLCRGLEQLPMHTLTAGRPAFWQLMAYTGLVLGGMALVFRIRRQEVENLAMMIRRAGESVFRRAFREARETALLLFLWLLAAGSLFFLREEKGLRITSLYVGQGDAQLITLPGGHSYMVDGGGGSDKVGEKVILPYLKCRGISRLEYILVSHPDSDHISGLQAVLEAPEIKVKGLLLPAVFRDSEKARELLETAREAQVPVGFLRAGDLLLDGEASLQVLYPGSSTQVDDNESSLVLRLDWQGFSMLFPGDLGEAGEAMILKAYGEAMEPVTVLKAGHHGSRFSSSEAFLGRLQPALTLISCGRNNRHGHPSPEALERLAAAGSRILRTDEAGAVELYIGEAGGLSCETFHEGEINYMKKEKSGKDASGFTIVASIIILAVGVLAMGLSLLTGGKETGASETEARTVPAVSASKAVGSGTYVFEESGRNEPSESAGWPLAAPSAQHEETQPELTLSPRAAEANGGRGGPDRDPQAEGFWLDLPLTDQLYLLMAGDLSNNTDEADPFRCLSADFKQELDAISEAFAAGEMTKEEAAAAFRGRQFSWPGDKLGLIHPLGDVSLRCYSYPGRDIALAKERILLSNVTARHYLFIRVYYNSLQDAVRIYMVNGLVY